MLKPEQVEQVLGQAEVRQVFKASKLGTIAGCMVTGGTIVRGSGVRVIRDGVVVHDGKMASLKRFQEERARSKKDSSAASCSMATTIFSRNGDVLEAYETREVARAE